jgi:hypothetical protein
MFSFLSKVLVSVVIAVSALFGGHEQAVPPAPVAVQQVSTSTQSVQNTVTAIQEPVKLNTPSSVVSTVQVKTETPVPTVDTQTVVTNTAPSQKVIVTPSAPITPTVVTAVTPPAPTVSITNSDASNPYDGFNVNWTATNATSCTLNSSPVLLAPVGSQVTGEIYTPTTYTITCTGEGGSVSNKIVVQPYPTCKPTPVSGENLGGYPTALINGKCVVLN